MLLIQAVHQIPRLADKVHNSALTSFRTAFRLLLTGATEVPSQHPPTWSCPDYLGREGHGPA